MLPISTHGGLKTEDYSFLFLFPNILSNIQSLFHYFDFKIEYIKLNALQKNAENRVASKQHIFFIFHHYRVTLFYISIPGFSAYAQSVGDIQELPVHKGQIMANMVEDLKHS